ncbi:hypothetical protein BDQ12DRAFT_699034 [Crucibulum laeve]|uniref:Galactose oxidase n=1 Tax=Crucibulum laeve TaxID=68775 RepID=A0A5C3LXP3_9AGAR|nr:hypothetical protein BDQ12DRAFT_699034 [Crucibulum laeve]
MGSRSLTDVPEEDSASLASPTASLASFTPVVPNSVYQNPAASSSASTFGGGSNRPSSSSSSSTVRKPASLRTLGQPSSSSSSSATGSVKRSTSMSSTSSARAPPAQTRSNAPPGPSLPRIRTIPRLPHDKDAEPAPSTMMYWSRAPVWGHLPMRTMRAHSLTLVDSAVWVIGGNEDREMAKDVYCFDTETMQWTRPETTGDIPPPCRAHSATIVDRKIVVIGGGLAGQYFDSIFILDTMTRRWTRPTMAPGSAKPTARRAHSAVLYQGKIWVFGGGSGMRALNDLWCLDVSGLASGKPLKWQLMETTGRTPRGRGYHTATLVGNVMVVIGGSDGKDSFKDVSCLDLDRLTWTTMLAEEQHRRLAHSSTQVGSYLFIWGGHDATHGSEYRNDLLLFNLVSLQYETRSVFGTLPSKRGHHSTVLADSRLFLFGGYNGTTAFDDVHVLDLAACAYLPQVRSFAFGDGAD